MIFPSRNFFLKITHFKNTLIRNRRFYPEEKDKKVWRMFSSIFAQRWLVANYFNTYWKSTNCYCKFLEKVSTLIQKAFLKTDPVFTWGFKNQTKSQATDFMKTNWCSQYFLTKAQLNIKIIKPGHKHKQVLLTKHPKELKKKKATLILSHIFIIH